MSEIVQAVLPDGTEVWIRVEEDDVPRDTGIGAAAHRRLGDLTSTLAGVAQAVRVGVRGAAPDEVSVECGLEIAMKAGRLVSVLTDAESKATLKVTMTWRANASTQPPDSPGAPPAP